MRSRRAGAILDRDPIDLDHGARLARESSTPEDRPQPPIEGEAEL